MPKRFFRNYGFTLIELLVVIAIIAILAAVSFATYSGVQKSARDTKRRAEVDSIAKSLEIRYQITSGSTCPPGGASSNGGFYCPIDASWFANNAVPTDTNAATPYCIWYNPSNSLNTIGSPTYSAGTWTSNACPTLPSEPASTVKTYILNGNPPVNGAAYFKVCAVMETNNSVYCVNSKQ